MSNKLTPRSKIDVVLNVHNHHYYHVLSFDGTIYKLQRMLSSTSSKSHHPIVFVTPEDFKLKYTKVT